MRSMQITLVPAQTTETAMSVQMTKDATDLTATVAAEVLLGKIRLNPHQEEPRYLHSFRRFLTPLIRVVGEGKMEIMVETIKPATHAMIAMLADKVIGFDHPKTKDRVCELSIPLRTAVETAVRAATGGANPGGRWGEELWEMKKQVSEIVDTSPSGLTREEIRLGYDDLIHAVVDKLYERWETLIN